MKIKNYGTIAYNIVPREKDMNLKREQEFVSQYHFDARNFEWENENGAPETKVDVNFQLLQHDQENQVTSLIVILLSLIHI